MIKKISILTLFFAFVSGHVLTQSIVQPEELTTEDGLSQGFIPHMLQDQEGFLWIGTKNGLNRYDGEQFQIFTNDPSEPYSISKDWANIILEKGDYLLIATEGGGLNVFHKQQKKFYKIPANNPKIQSWSTMYIEQIVFDNSDQLWVLESDSRQLLRLRFPTEFWKKLPLDETLLKKIEMTSFPNLQLSDISKGEENNIYGLQSSNKIMKIEVHSGDWEWLPHQPAFQATIDLISNFKNDILGFTAQQIISYKDKEWQICTADLKIKDLHYDRLGKKLWVATDIETLLFEQWDSNVKSINYSDASMRFSNKFHVSFHRDRSGILWVGTGGDGLLKISPRLTKIKNQFQGSSIYAQPFMTTDGEIILSTPNYNKLLSNTNSFDFQDSLRGVRWLKDKNNMVWMLGQDNLDQVVLYQWAIDSIPKKKDIINCQCSEFPTATIDQGKNFIWVACPTGQLIRYDLSTQQQKFYSFKNLFHSKYNCYSITQTENGHWWIGTSLGLIQAIPEGENFRFKLIQSADKLGLLNDEIASLLVDQLDANILWIGTKGGGLHRLDTKTMTFAHFNKKNGVPNDVIYGVLNDVENNIWMSSNKGIIKLNPTTGKIRTYTEADGMQSNEFNTWAYAKAPSGELIFGGIKGLNVFHPDDLTENTVEPKVWITGLSINNEAVRIRDSTNVLSKAIEYTTEIELPYSKNNISVSFAALEFSAPLENRFRYYLEGAEAEWIHETTDNKATYLNLDPGNYTFKIKASNGDGVWNEEARTLKINIFPPWYRTNFAYLTYAILLALGVFLFLRFQRRRLQLRHEMELEQKEKQRLKELDQAKSRLYTNITHEFRTPLTVISGLAAQLEDTEEVKEPIQRNSEQLLNLVNQMLDLRKLESGNIRMHYKQGDLIRYIRYLTESFQSYANSIGITFHFLSEEEDLIMDFDKEKIARIVSNLLSNAIKFTPSGGNVYIRIEIRDAHFLLEIKDTGRGIPKQELPHIFNRFYQVDDTSTRKDEGTGIGLTLVKELLVAMKGDIKVSSVEGKGTTFTIKLPIKNDAPVDQDNYNVSSIFIPQETTATEKTRLFNDSDSVSNTIDRPTILLIEDNADVIHYLVRCLRADYQLDIAMNGEEGIDKAIDHTPDFIISDVMMPKKDGFEVCQTLKTDERTSHIPIILLTAKADIESRLEGLQQGADAYLAKPFHQEELLLHIQNFLSLRQKMQAKYKQLTWQTKPSSTSLSPITDLEDAFLQKIRAIIEKDLSNSEIGMPQLVRKIGMSRSQIYKKVKALTGKSPSQYMRSIRLAHAQRLLQTTDLNISEVGYEVGFTSPVYFSQVFFEEFGVRPNEIRK